MKSIFLVIFTFMLSACAMQTLKEGLPYLVGQPIEAAVNVLGLPTSKSEMAGYTVYEWNNQFSTAVPITQANTSYTSGTVGSVPVYGNTTTYSTNYVPVNNQCRIKLAVSAEGIIERWEYFGNQGGCQYYANGLKQIIPKKL